MKLRVQDQEEDQRGPGESLYEKTVKQQYHSAAAAAAAAAAAEVW